ncbi:MAG TPA: thioredoxin family protein [Thermoanaerobaculia bacterium]|nr:thioredoxin family protein [Thermoanaerobaculia bacterium]
MRTLTSSLLVAFAGFSLAATVAAQLTSKPVAPETAVTAAVAAAEAARPEASVRVGKVTREQVEEAAPEWTMAEAKAAPDAAAARALGKVAPGASITIYLGTWCGDSRREVSRFFRALDEMGGEFPAAVELIGVDEAKKEPADLLAGADVRYVPTIIVRRDGKEVGRIVESSPHGIETDLLDLLEGRAAGVLSLRTDLAPESPKP